MKDEMVKIYKHQLKFGCKRPSCTKIFCKATSDDSTAETVASILSLYSDDFVCENINKTFINPQYTYREEDKQYTHKQFFYRDGGFWCTDLLLFYLNLFQTKKNEVLFFKNCSKNITEKAPYDLDSTNLDDKILSRIYDRKTIPDKLFGIEMKLKNINLAFDCENSHKFCKYFNKETVTQEEIVVLTGVVGILIRKYDKMPHYTLGLLIIRIINLLGENIDFSVQQISTIHNIYYNIRLVGVNMKKSNVKNTSNERYLRRTSFHSCSKESRIRMDNLENSNSFSEEYDQCSVLVSNESTNNLICSDPRITETQVEQHYVEQQPTTVLHNVIMNTDFENTILHNNIINTDFDSTVMNTEFDTSLMQPSNLQPSNLQPSNLQPSNSSSCLDLNNNWLEEECYKNIYLNNNTKYTCLNSVLFNRNDLIRSVCLFASYLNSAVVTDIRENKKIETGLNIFHLLYLINEEVLILGYKRFYLSNFCARMNFREEFKFYRTKSKTPLKYSFILPVHIKAELIKAKNNDMMKSSLQDSFFRALFEGHIGPYLFITVSRDNIYKESMDLVRCLNIDDVRKQLRITFKHEEGVDSGGIRKEYFQLLSHEIKHDERLFYNHESTIWLRNDCLDMSSYTTIGRILGIALYNNVLLNIPFPSVFFKKLLDKKTTFYDLKEIDPELFVSLCNLRKLSEEELASLSLTFTINYTSSKKKIKTYNLTEDKSERVVTKANVNSFVNRYADFYINRAIYRQFEAIKEGFLFVLERDTLSFLDNKELEKIIMGSNEFDVHTLRSTTSYTDYNYDSKIINWFWETFESYGKKMRKKLLQFITGNDRIPVAGAASVRLIIMRNGCDTDRLPSSQTCFNTLLLPEYSSKKKLESKLRTALEMTAGFYLL